MFRVQFILIGVLAALSVQARATTNDLITAGVAEFTAAYQQWDGERFAAAAELFRRANSKTLDNPVTLYWLGATQFHLMLQLLSNPANRSAEASAKAAIEDAVEALTLAIQLDERQAESHALLGTLYGMKINGSLFRALRFGPQIMKHQELALKYGATNPRVQYLYGMCLFHTSKRKSGWQTALDTLLTAEELFQAEEKTTATNLEPRWGLSSCLTFIGRSYENLGKEKAAEAYFRKALERHPKDNLAREGLRRVSVEK